MNVCRASVAKWVWVWVLGYGVWAVGGERARVDLCGPWDFRLDPQDQGVAERWFTAEAVYPDKIKVPGNWQTQGFGPQRGHLRNDYQGRAWYRRSVEIPADWAGRRIWLHLGGTSNTAEVYVNGKKVGVVEGFVTPYEFDISEFVQPGAAAVIACRVDSTGVAPVGMFNFIGRWGGLYRGVHLEARSDPAIDDLFVIPDLAQQTARVRVVLRRSRTDAAWQGDLAVRVSPCSGGGPEFQASGPIRFAPGQAESEPAIINVKIDPMRPWSPEDPFLYRVEVKLLAGGQCLDVVSDRFGMRQLTVGKGGVLLLNGRPYFIRGLGDDSVEVLTGTQYPDKSIYVNRLRMAKRYGFNGIRFLSNTPIKEYFEAADEVGMLILCEGQVYHKPKEAIPLLKKQVERIVKAYRNHPSWYAFSAANELFECEGDKPKPDWIDYVRYAHAKFKELDPTRFFIGSEGADVFPTDIITKRAKMDPPPSPDQRFDGLIDEVAYFKRALSEAEVQKLADPSTPNYAEAVKALAPEAYWRLEEKGVGQAADSSGHGHHGVYEPTMEPGDFSQPGALKPASASTAIRTRPKSRGVDLPAAAASTFAAGIAPFSVSLWVRPDCFAPGDYGTPFSFGAPVRGRGFLIAEDGEKGLGHIRLGGYYKEFLVSAGAMSVGRWNHLAVVYDGTELKLYLNGKLDSKAKVQMDIVPQAGRIGSCITAGPVDPSWQAEYEKYEKYAGRPYLWHEFPNSYVGPFPDLSLVEKYTGVFIDNNCISYHRRQIAELGLTDRYPQIQRRSVDLFYLYLKEQFENARWRPTLDGYHYWCFTDYPGDVEGDMPTFGIFNTLYEPEKFPDPAPIVQFNRETVLLNRDGPWERVLAAGQPKQTTLAISHYGEQPIHNGRVVWTVQAGPQTLAQGVLAPVEVKVGEVKPIGEITLGPFPLSRAEHFRLVVHLDSEACQQTNHWDYWVFPAKNPDLGPVRIKNLTGSKTLDARYAVEPNISWEQAEVVLARRLTKQIAHQVASGKSLILLPDGQALARPRGIGFYANWIQSVGTWIEPHPALDGMPHDGFCAYQFYRLFGNGLAALNTTERGSPEREKSAPIISGMRQDYDPKVGKEWFQPTNRWKFYRYGILSEGRIGQGKILVCCLQVLEGVENGLPEAGYLLDCLVRYAASDRFTPSIPPLTLEELPQVFLVEEESK